jgi:hypothetical protein
VKKTVCWAALLILAIVPVSTQNQPPAVRSAIAGVLIDVTVLDRDGRPITDLKSEDFELSEDGKPQQLISATLILGGMPSTAPGRVGAGMAPPGAASAASGAASVQVAVPGVIPTVTAILFDSLSMANSQSRRRDA